MRNALDVWRKIKNKMRTSSDKRKRLSSCCWMPRNSYWIPVVICRWVMFRSRSQALPSWGVGWPIPSNYFTILPNIFLGLTAAHIDTSSFELTKLPWWNKLDLPFDFDLIWLLTNSMVTLSRTETEYKCDAKFSKFSPSEFCQMFPQNPGNGLSETLNLKISSLSAPQSKRASYGTAIHNIFT